MNYKLTFIFYIIRLIYIKSASNNNSSANCYNVRFNRFRLGETGGTQRLINCDFPRRLQTDPALHERSLSSLSLRLHNAA
jgi:hypothetical protein